ncbi:MAG TPA: hypothetical protein VGI75_02485 [Pirellulales bacterium]|jgi:hypothetical protein
MSSTLSPKFSNQSAATSSALPSTGAAPGKMPGETVRALVSLWLFFHLFCVVLALMTNTSYDPPFSQLVGKLKATFSPYMYALWLDAPHNYRWTYGESQDADHTLEAEWDGPDGRQTRQFPPADARGEVRERYEILAQRAAMPIYNESSDRAVIKGVGEGIIGSTGAKEVIFRITRHSPLNIQDAVADDPGQRDPDNQRTKALAYTGAVKMNSLGEGEVNNLNQEARDVAPVTNRSERGSNRSQPKAGATTDTDSDAPPPPPKNSRHQTAPDLPPAEKKSGPASDILKGLVPKDDSTGSK